MPRHIVPAVALGILLLGAVVFGIAQLAETKKLRTHLATLDQERTDLRKRIWELQKLNSELAARPGKTSSDGKASSSEGDTPPEETSSVSRPRLDGNRFAALMNTPEVQQLMTLQQKAGLDSGYAALFKRLNLSPADLEKFKNLLVEKQSAIMDVMAAARNQGLTGRESRDEIRKLVQDAQAEIDGHIHATLGEAAYGQFKNYEATLPQRGVVSQLEKRLSYSPTPLSDTQTEQLVQILAETTPVSGSANRSSSSLLLQVIPGSTQAAAFLDGGARITNDAIARAQGVLAAPQLTALQSLQQEQEAAARLRQQMRTSPTNRTRTAPRGNTPLPPPGGS